MKSNELIRYKYRGVFYQKTKPQKYSTNLVLSRIERSSSNISSKELKYRGIPYNASSKQIIVDRIISLRIQKYRGVNYLTQIVDLLMGDRANRQPNITQTSKVN